MAQALREGFCTAHEIRPETGITLHPRCCNLYHDRPSTRSPSNKTRVHANPPFSSMSPPLRGHTSLHLAGERAKATKTRNNRERATTPTYNRSTPSSPSATIAEQWHHIALFSKQTLPPVVHCYLCSLLQVPPERLVPALAQLQHHRPGPHFLEHVLDVSSRCVRAVQAAHL